MASELQSCRKRVPEFTFGSLWHSKQQGPSRQLGSECAVLFQTAVECRTPRIDHHGPTIPSRDLGHLQRMSGTFESPQVDPIKVWPPIEFGRVTIAPFSSIQEQYPAEDINMCQSIFSDLLGLRFVTATLSSVPRPTGGPAIRPQD